MSRPGVAVEGICKAPLRVAVEGICKAPGPEKGSEKHLGLRRGSKPSRPFCSERGRV